MKAQKLTIKLYDPKTDTYGWEHVCYVSSQLYHKFKQQKGISSLNMNDVLSDWAKTDFHVDLPIDTKEGLKILKALVIDRFIALYPTIYDVGLIDTKGWMRVWVHSHMEKEVL